MSSIAKTINKEKNANNNNSVKNDIRSSHQKSFSHSSGNLDKKELVELKKFLKEYASKYQELISDNDCIEDNKENKDKVNKDDNKSLSFINFLNQIIHHDLDKHVLDKLNNKEVYNYKQHLFKKFVYYFNSFSEIFEDDRNSNSNNSNDKDIDYLYQYSKEATEKFILNTDKYSNKFEINSNSDNGIFSNSNFIINIMSSIINKEKILLEDRKNELNNIIKEKNNIKISNRENNTNTNDDNILHNDVDLIIDENDELVVKDNRDKLKSDKNKDVDLSNYSNNEIIFIRELNKFKYNRKLLIKHEININIDGCINTVKDNNELNDNMDYFKSLDSINMRNKVLNNKILEILNNKSNSISSFPNNHGREFTIRLCKDSIDRNNSLNSFCLFIKEVILSIISFLASKRVSNLLNCSILLLGLMIILKLAFLHYDDNLKYY